MLDQSEIRIIRRAMKMEHGIPLTPPEEKGRKVISRIDRVLKNDETLPELVKTYARGAMMWHYGINYTGGALDHRIKPILAYAWPQLLASLIVAGLVGCAGFLFLREEFFGSQVDPETAKSVVSVAFFCIGYLVIVHAILKTYMRRKLKNVIPASLAEEVFKDSTHEIETHEQGDGAILATQSAKGSKDGLLRIVEDPTRLILKSPGGESGWLSFWINNDRECRRILHTHKFEATAERLSGRA